MRERVAFVALGIVVLLAAGCGSPVSTVAKLGMKVAGKVVDDTGAQKLAGQLVGKPPSAADQALGERVDTFQDIKGNRQWITYPVKLDVLGSKRYVVAAANDRITAVEMIEKEGGGMGTAQRLMYLAKAKGKSPAECQSALGMGPPVLAVRSRNTGGLIQLYDSRKVKELQGAQWCIVRYDKAGLCEKVDLVGGQSGATVNAAP